jgi:hypothetical protein
MTESTNPEADKPAITVAGITFTADQVLSVTVKIDGRRIHIDEREADKPPPIGFPT